MSQSLSKLYPWQKGGSLTSSKRPKALNSSHLSTLHPHNGGSWCAYSISDGYVRVPESQDAMSRLCHCHASSNGPWIDRQLWPLLAAYGFGSWKGKVSNVLSHVA